MNFLHPYNLLFLLLIPIYIGFIYLQKNKKKAIGVSVFDDLLQSSRKNFVYYRNIFNHILIILIIIFFSLTLARPQGKHEKHEVSKNGIDIIIALDVSESMLAEDLKPNRIEAAKESINKFVKKLENDRLGIVVFAGMPFTQSPLTFDYNILSEYIKNISTDSINKGVRGLSGTAIGDAILAGVNRFDKNKEENEDRTKVLILLTDGDANTGVDPEVAALKAKKENIRIYTIGIGREGGAPLIARDMFGKKTYARNRDGSVMMATFNEDALRKLASLGGGRYFRASDNETFLDVMNEINSLEKRDIKVNSRTEYSENFFGYLVVLFLLFFIYIVFNNFKSIRK